ncbi:DNA polymerase/3'-5' exonuclease PolX [Methanosphaerula palustris]|uniref:DNA-directed DNA polymerase n=1 Tax=Methanosphaerula palustris (strain ATCC BAA-1556 / DSM 19958 / E1-9c) TaxID=521011 RepID=B8GIF4_METPE|nr:DNA polymerase/3'-5' exonuclease PolX [Methanosphaerula palustris]ACL15505.1 PHP domain protein [Methanosphaerula palustris E1-9c]
MGCTNRQAADTIRFISQLLEIRGEDPFRVRAFQRAAMAIEGLGEPVCSMAPEQVLAVPGIGPHTAAQIRELCAGEESSLLQDLQQSIPASVIALLELDQVGPKTVHRLWHELGISTIEDLEKAALAHQVSTLKGFGAKKEEELVKAIARHRRSTGRMTRVAAEAVLREVTALLVEGTYTIAGSYRRGRATIGDIDIVSTEAPAEVNSRLVSLADEVIDQGEKRTSIRVMGQRVDVRFCTPDQCGPMLLYLTGSKDFNIKLREIALSAGWRLNEYGVEERTTGAHRTAATEEEIFSMLGMDPVPPELREDRGEVEAAREHTLPTLVMADDLQGDLHVHSRWSDGSMTIAELATAGEERGYQYIICSDHSASLGIAHGLSAAEVRDQQHEIEMVNRTSSCQVLAGIEVDILSNGSLGLPDRTLQDLDLVVASIHSGFHQEEDQITRRIIGAIENEHVDIIGHPTGRVLGQRDPYAVDLHRVIEAAALHRTALEINASPFRLDMDDTAVREARDGGIVISLGSDAHARSELENMSYGLLMARRGWCRPADLLNTRDLSSVLEWAA